MRRKRQQLSEEESSATATIRIRTKPCRKRLKADWPICWPSALTSSI